MTSLSERVPPSLWWRDARDELLWRNWGEAHFAFHTASGQTHFLNELAARIVTLVENAPKTAEDISRRLREEYEIEESGELEDAVDGTLHQLRRLGLVDLVGSA